MTSGDGSGMTSGNVSEGRLRAVFRRDDFGQCFGGGFGQCFGRMTSGNVSGVASDDGSGDDFG